MSHPYLPPEEEPEYIKNRSHFEREHERPWWQRAFIVTGAGLALVGMLFLSGIQQYFFYRQTPASVEQKELSAVVEGEQITVSLSVVVLTAEELGHSPRTRGEVARMVEKASNILQQARITLSLASFQQISLNQDEVLQLRRDPVAFARTLTPVEENTISVFLLRDLAGINGVAFGRLGTIALAEHTSSFDFRVLAHEVGHTLGLGHVHDTRRLMHSGATGTTLAPQEAQTMRATANTLNQSQK